MTAGGDDNKSGPVIGDEALARRMAKASEVSKRESSDKALSRAGSGSVIRFAVAVLLLVGMLIMIIVSVGGASRHDEAVRANMHTIDELRSALADEEVAAQTGQDADALRRTLTRASSSGDDLESIQNDMASLDMEARDPTPALTEYADLVDESRSYFTVGSLTGGSFLPHGRWYQPFEPGRDSRGQAAWVQLPSDEWQWRFVPTRSVDQSGNVAGVWLATLTGGSQDGELLAWVTGWFDSRRDLWYGMQRGLTDLGMKHAGATNSSFEFDGDEGTILEPSPDTQALIDEAQRAAERSSRGGGSSSPTASPSRGGSGSGGSGSDSGSSGSDVDADDADSGGNADGEMDDPGLGG